MYPGLLMRILVVADIHGKFQVLQRIMDDVVGEKYDLIVSQGDFTDMFESTQDFTQMEVADTVLQKLLIPKKPVLCVPGNHDPYEILDLFEDYGVNVHHKTRKVGDSTFVGWGGADTPFNTHFEPSEEETEEALTDILKKVRSEWILISHAPPKNTTLDKIGPRKHVGSSAIRKIIEKKRPLVAFSAHIHENKGVERIGKTQVFYPGPAYDGYYGFVSIENKKIECETRKVPAQN